MRTPVAVWRLSGVIGGALSLVLAGCVASTEPPGASFPLENARYVAMGSSFGAGSGFGPIKPGSPKRCGRSTENYASVLANRLHMALTDVACGGATSAYILGPWKELPPQIEAVTPDTRLVTVTVGGNDIGYVAYLIGESCKARGPIPIPGGEIPCFDPRVPTEDEYQRLETSLRAVAHEVKERAPQARLAFVQYMPMISDTRCDAIPLSAEAAQTARKIGLRLAEITARVAHETGAMLIPMDKIDKSYMPCGPDPWVTGYPADYKAGDSAPWHPTRAGHAAIADVIAERLSGQESD